MSANITIGGVPVTSDIAEGRYPM